MDFDDLDEVEELNRDAAAGDDAQCPGDDGRHLSQRDLQWQAFVRRREEDARREQEEEQRRREDARQRRWAEEDAEWLQVIQHYDGMAGRPESYATPVRPFCAPTERHSADEGPGSDLEEGSCAAEEPPEAGDERERCKEAMARHQQERRQRWELAAGGPAPCTSPVDEIERWCSRLLAGTRDRNATERRKEVLQKKHREQELKDAGVAVACDPEVEASDDEPRRVPGVDQLLAAIDREQAADQEYEVVKHLLPEMESYGDSVLAIPGRGGPELAADAPQTRQLEMIEQGIEAAVAQEAEGATERVARVQVERLRAERASMEEARLRYEKRRARERAELSFAVPPGNAKVVAPGSLAGGGLLPSSSSGAYAPGGGTGGSVPLPKCLGRRKAANDDAGAGRVAPRASHAAGDARAAEQVPQDTIPPPHDDARGAGGGDSGSRGPEIEVSEEHEEILAEIERLQRANDSKERLKRMKERRRQRELEERLETQRQLEHG